MICGKFNVVTDGQWGSCGKGLIATALADKYRPQMISTTNMANAGHTSINENGEAFIAKAIPSCSALKKWRKDSGYNPWIVLGSTCAFHIDRLLEEIIKCDINDRLVIHERAGVITQVHREAEGDLTTGTKHIGSTMQGCATFLADKIMRRKELKLARDYPELQDYLSLGMAQRLKDISLLQSGRHARTEPSPLNGLSFPLVLDRLMKQHEFTILHEGSQGFSLDINHGSHYPQCTSRSTTAVQNLSDIGLPTQAMGDVYLVIRPYPIRVGNIVEDGKTVGYSGDAYPGQKELSWKDVSEAAGAPPEVTKGELTTVTKRLRRVFEFSDTQLQEAVVSNGATKLALNFANYVDYDCYGMNSYDDLPKKVKEFIVRCEDVAQIPVTVVGTGPQNNHVCFIN